MRTPPWSLTFCSLSSVSKYDTRGVHGIVDVVFMKSLRVKLCLSCLIPAVAALMFSVVAQHVSQAAASVFHLKADSVLCQKPNPVLTKTQGWHAVGKEVLDRHSQAGHCWGSGIHSVRTGICQEQGWWSYWVNWDWQQLQHRAANNRHHHKPQPEILSGCSCSQDVLLLLAGE